MFYNVMDKLITIILILLSMVSISYAENFISQGYIGETIEAKLALAKYSEPIWYVVGDKSVLLKEIIKEECGEQPLDFNQYLIKKTLKINGEESVENLIEPDSAIAIPFCHKYINTITKVKIKEGDTLSKIAYDNLRFTGNKTLASIVELNNELQQITSDDIDAINAYSQSLRPGKEIYIPYQIQKKTFRQLKDGMSPSDIVAKFPPENHGIQEVIKTIKPSKDLRRIKLAPVGFVTNNSETSTDDCPGSGGIITNQPFDYEQIKERMEIETRYLNNHGHSVETVSIGIIDSGLRSIDNNFFKEKLFVENKSENSQFSYIREDDDGNGHIDDVWGSNFSDYNGVIQASGGDNSSHGTAMAALILGGVNYVNSFDEEELPFVRLRVVNFSSTYSSGMVDPSLLIDAIEYLSDSSTPSIKIVNLSLNSKTKINNIKKGIVSNPKLLFINAAANNNSGGKNLSREPAYPASLSGHASINQITVASHQPNGKHAPHSNWGKSVDLHAPGCAIKTINTDGSIRSETGSSVATAIVSFSAGLVRSLGGAFMSSDKIKRRLIASSDMSDDLQGKSWTKGKLNTLKAVSLTHDVIEIKEADSYIFSRLKDIDHLRIFCSDIDKRMDLNNIAKVRPNIHVKDNPNLMIEYWVEESMRISPIQCEQVNSTESIGLMLVGEEEIEGPKLENVIDIVVASLRVSES